MKTSKHATIRGQQRGISKELMDIVYSFGARIPSHGNAEEYRLTKKRSRMLIAEHKKNLQHIKRSCDSLVFSEVPKKIKNILIQKEIDFIKDVDKACGKVAVMSRDDSTIITVYSLN